MAEKEERIWIGTTGKKIQLNHMTRQEAINCIGNALWEEGLKEGAAYYAKVALDALLEADK